MVHSRWYHSRLYTQWMVHSRWFTVNGTTVDPTTVDGTHSQCYTVDGSQSMVHSRWYHSRWYTQSMVHSRTQNSELRTFYLTNKQNNGDKLNDIN